MKVKVHRKALQQLLRDPGVGRDLSARTARVAAAAGEGFVGNVVQGKSRLRGGVVTASREAKRRAASENALVKALDAGR